jgi:tRNA(Ile)-lysidine synthase
MVQHLAVAASGGMDSTALLHCVLRQSAGTDVVVHVLHVQHGLHPDAERWLQQLAGQCRRWRRRGHGVEFHAHRVSSAPAAGDSVEAWARRVRYQALADMAREAACSVVLLAQHRRDQAETVMLQALRGAGPAGLAAMPGEVHRDGLIWLRPWLDQPHAAIAAYTRRWKLHFVADPANEDDRYLRSRLRQRVWPTLLQQLPEVEQALAAVARRAHEARQVLDEVAAADAVVVGSDPGLRRAAWLGLSPARRANVLRHWLSRQADQAVPETLVQRLLHELPQARACQWPWGTGSLVLHRGVLLLRPAVGPRPDKPTLHRVTGPKSIDLSQPGLYPLHPWPGVLRVSPLPPASKAGLPAQWLRQAQLVERQGGEQFQRHLGGPPRSLKKQFQAQDVPRWQRDVPLVVVAGQLVFVPGLGVDARAAAMPGSPRVELTLQT